VRSIWHGRIHWVSDPEKISWRMCVRPILGP
jgi:hypothetical protein